MGGGVGGGRAGAVCGWPWGWPRPQCGCLADLFFTTPHSPMRRCPTWRARCLSWSWASYWTSRWGAGVWPRGWGGGCGV